ncbi:MAG: hypothetical protein L6W00_15200 [Lentisphaeria bacterium]|nr:MAG: hypothetical protein L6W00_15200 [Lentisphaeria bacterium]
MDKMLGYLKGVHDWAWMDGGSNDSGDNGPVVDCAQAAYGGYASLLRMAHAMRDPDMQRLAAYHLAKSQLPLIARTAFRDYGHENGVLGPDHQNAGFREFITPDSYANSPMIGLTARNEYDGSFDSVISYALVDGFDIFFPYAKYVWNDLRRDEEIRSLYWPNRDRGVSRMMLHLYSRLVWLMIDGMPQEQALALLDRWTPPATYFRRPAVREIYPVVLTGGCPLTLTGWDPLPEPEFTFDPAERRVRLRFRSVPEGYSFAGLSASEPAGVLVAGGKRAIPLRFHHPAVDGGAPGGWRASGGNPVFHNRTGAFRAAAAAAAPGRNSDRKWVGTGEFCAGSLLHSLEACAGSRRRKS